MSERTIALDVAEPLDGKNFVSTRNACKVCTPMGACLAFLGVRKAVPFLHGSQGCATYMRRYLISHFREPVDIASSSISESTAVFGGGENFQRGILNVVRQYEPEFIGVATTCLSETVGEDVPAFVRELKRSFDASPPAAVPAVVHVSTPSFRGTHADGFHEAVRGIAEQLATGGTQADQVNLFPNMVSPADLRYLKELFRDFGMAATVLPDYSEALDGGAWTEYQSLPTGGTPVEAIRRMGQARASIEFTSVLADRGTAATVLHKKFGVPAVRLALPIGIKATDSFTAHLCRLSGKPLPVIHAAERARLFDAYADAHKYLFGKRVVVYGDEDLVVSMTAWLAEIGASPVLVASGGKSGRLATAIREAVGEEANEMLILDGVDFVEIGEQAAALAPDLLLGNSKGFSIARKLKRPLVRVGFPIHDRFGGQRLLHVGYRGAQQLLDRVVNALLEYKQESSSVGYGYL